MMNIWLNDEPRDLEERTTLLHALQQWGYACERIAVAVNGEFVPRGAYAQTLLQSRDRLDVVAPVQGG